MSEQAQHTPGPWEVRKESLKQYQDEDAKPDVTVWHEQAGVGRSKIATLRDLDVCEEHGSYLANARLIAAAIDLLNALEEVASSAACLPGYTLSDALPVIHAAIAKAKGKQ